MWSSVVSALLGKVAPKVADFYIKKQELKAQIEIKKLEGKIAYEEAKTRRAEASEGRDHEWELASIQNSGWKDEWVLIILSIPMILVFVPFTQSTILHGFTVLEGTPLWYRTTVMTIYLATFGLRLWRRDMNKAGAPSITE
jgi:hypothetical protein